ncbi:MAG: FixH family protein [Bacteroidetes bacterium]|nr:FixH family protein [Bacteroidota bacterium]
MNWGKWIVVSFILFALFIGTLTAVCMREDVSLVSRNYYQEELLFQQQIARMNNAAQLPERPSVRISDGQLEVAYSDFSNLEKGSLTLFRPSDEKLDRRFDLRTVSDPIQRFDVSQLPAGLYKVKLLWSSRGKEYYTENNIYL